MMKLLSRILPDNYIYFIKKNVFLRAFLWGSATKEIGEYLFKAPSESFYLPPPDKSLDEAASVWFLDCYNRYHQRGFFRSYVLVCNNCVIEPRFGWGIDVKTNKLIFDSIAYNTWKEELYPNYFKYLNRKKINERYYPEIISIRMIRDGEHNYWHFLHDILGQVLLAQKKLNVKLPFLISKTLSQKKYFKDALAQSTLLREINWIVQEENEYIKTDKVYFLQSQPHNPNVFYGLLQLLEVKKPSTPPERRIFLKRNSKRVRSLANSSAIEEVAVKYNFEIVDADVISLAEQIKIFGETKYLIGIHGAGLINIMFAMPGEMVVFELFPVEYIPPHYYWLSLEMQEDYLCQVGTEMDKNGAFTISPDVFENNIKTMLSIK